MTVRRPRYSKEEYARRGNEIYERQVRPQLEGADAGDRRWHRHQELQERLGLVSGGVVGDRVGVEVAQVREPMVAVSPGWSVFSRMVTSYPRASRIWASFFIEICCRLLSTRER